MKIRENTTVGMIDNLLDAAETAIRQRGYHSVSFRELAEDVGIKSASVHYYFPQKEDLAVAVVERYSKSFFETLEKNTTPGSSVQERLFVFCNAYRNALSEANLACLCGILGAETCGLPDTVSKTVVGFFEDNLAWLAGIFPSDLSPGEKRVCATEILVAMQGGMMIATALKDPSLFDNIVERVVQSDLCSRLQQSKD